MISNVFYLLFYNPIYNALVALISVIPSSDAGIAIIVLTVIMRLLLLPFSLSVARTQQAMKTLQPKIKELKEKHKGDKEKEAIETLALYKEARVNPFASILTFFIQIPLLLALYFVFSHESFTAVNIARLYAFTPVPQSISLQFLGLISVTSKSLVLAVIAALTQYYQANMALKGTMRPEEAQGMKGDFQRVMSLQLKYVFPVLIGTISYTTSGAIALYFITTNLAGSAQELYMRKKLAQVSDSSQLV